MQPGYLNLGNFNQIMSDFVEAYESHTGLPEVFSIKVPKNDFFKWT